MIRFALSIGEFLFLLSQFEAAACKLLRREDDGPHQVSSAMRETLSCRPARYQYSNSKAVTATCCFEYLAILEIM